MSLSSSTQISTLIEFILTWRSDELKPMISPIKSLTNAVSINPNRTQPSDRKRNLILPIWFRIFWILPRCYFYFPLLLWGFSSNRLFVNISYINDLGWFSLTNQSKNTVAIESWLKYFVKIQLRCWIYFIVNISRKK